MNSSYHALRTAAAWGDLSTRGKLIARGEDRARLLHAMSTNHIQQLQPGQGCYAFFLTPQGRIIADAYVFAFDDRLLLDTEPETTAKLFAHLDKYIIADDVTLTDETDSFGTLTLEGPTASEILEQLGSPVPEADGSHAEWDDVTVAHVSSTGLPGFRLFTPLAFKAELILQLESAGAVVADADTLRTVRLEHGRPRYGEDITEANIPQETQQTHALHFQKGCYVGQEIVERVRSRGHVNKQLIRLSLDTTTLPQPGEKLTTNEGKEAGTVTSAALSPETGQVVALAYVRTEYADTPLALVSAPVG